MSIQISFWHALLQSYSQHSMSGVAKLHCHINPGNYRGSGGSGCHFSAKHCRNVYIYIYIYLTNTNSSLKHDRQVMIMWFTSCPTCNITVNLPPFPSIFLSVIFHSVSWPNNSKRATQWKRKKLCQDSLFLLPQILPFHLALTCILCPDFDYSRFD